MGYMAAGDRCSCKECALLQGCRSTSHHICQWYTLRAAPENQPAARCRAPAGNLRLQLYEYKAGFSSADRPPGHSANTPFHAYSSWQV